VGRTYAGILGSLAMAVVLVRGVMAGGGAEESLIHAVAAMIVFGLIGLVVGGIASWMVEEAVYAQVQQEVTALEAQKNNRSEHNTTR
jgi:hypothetical protein